MNHYDWRIRYSEQQSNHTYYTLLSPIRYREKQSDHTYYTLLQHLDSFLLHSFVAPFNQPQQTLQIFQKQNYFPQPNYQVFRVQGFTFFIPQLGTLLYCYCPSRPVQAIHCLPMEGVFFYMTCGLWRQFHSAFGIIAHSPQFGKRNQTWHFIFIFKFKKWDGPNQDHYGRILWKDLEQNLRDKS